MRELSDADYRLKQDNKDASVDRLLAVVKRHELTEQVGIRLLHRHNEIASHEAMVEDSVIDSTGFALITKAKPTSSLSNDYVPNSWMLSDAGFVPVEFSHIDLINDPDVNPMTNLAFFDELAREIRCLGLSSLVGPSLLGSSLIDQHRPADSTMMIELTAQDDRANILRFVVNQDREASVNGNVIETHWCLRASGEDEDEKSVTTKTCTKICPAIGNPPKHQGTFIHQQPNP